MKGDDFLVRRVHVGLRITFQVYRRGEPKARSYGEYSTARAADAEAGRLNCEVAKVRS